MSDNYFARLNAIDVSEHIEKKGGFSYLILAIRRSATAPGRPDGVLGGAPLQRPAVPVQRTRRLRRGRGHGSGRDAQSDSSGARRTEPADHCAHVVRHQHVDPASACEGNRSARPRSVHLRRRGPAAAGRRRSQRQRTCDAATAEPRAAARTARTDDLTGAASNDPSPGAGSRDRRVSACSTTSASAA